MRWPLVAIFAYVLTVIQTSLFSTPRLLAFEFFHVVLQPDLLLILAVYLALVAEPGHAFIAAWCLGLVEDLTIQQGPLGVTALLFAAAAYLVSLVRGVLVHERILMQCLLALVIVLLLRLPQQMLLFWLADRETSAFSTLLKGMGDGLYSAILAPYLFWVLRKTVGGLPRRP